MAGGADVEEAGRVVACPVCSTEVKEHSMIPVLAEGSEGPDAVTRLVCVTCARAMIDQQPG